MNILDYFNRLDCRSIKELRHCRSIDEGMNSTAFLKMNFINKKWPRSQDRGACAALLLFSMIKNTNDDGFIAAWAKLSPNPKSNSRHINENRFLKLVQATDWDELYQAAYTGVRLLMKNNHSVDIDDLFALLERRSQEWEWPNSFPGSKQFALHAYSIFNENQS